MKDHVICTYCNQEQLVNIGEEYCSNCGHKGTLMWVNENNQEVKDDYIIKNTILKTKYGEIIQGDNLKIIDIFKNEYYDNCISDFPYNLAFMGKKWDNQKNFYNWCYQRAEKLYSKIKKGGYVLIFGHHKSNHRMKCAFEDAGFKIVEEINWIYGSGFSKNQDISKMFDKKYKKERKIVGVSNRHNSRSFGKGNKKDNIYSNFKGGIPNITEPSSNLAKQWNGYKTSGLKPAKEIITVFQKPLDKNYCNNIEKYQCGAMNINNCRIKTNEEITNHSRSLEASKSKGIYHDSKQQKTHQTEGQKLGRFPSNIIFDNNMGQILDKQSGILKSGSGNGNAKIGEVTKGAITPLRRGKLISRYDKGGASRYFLNINFEKNDFVPFLYCPKPTKKEKGTNNKHITVKPKKLIKWLIKLVTPINGKTLDITAGSCTHGVSATELNLYEGYNIEWVDIELMNTEEEPYCDIGKQRIERLINNEEI